MSQRLPIVFVLVTSLAGMAWFWQSRQPIEPIRIGVVHALTGTMAVSEAPLVDAIRLAVEEINSTGGLLGRPLEMIVADSGSDSALAASEADRLISQNKVSVLFACWTSACRQAVRSVVESHHHLMFYPVQYEGMEQSPNIIYTGAAPNQQIIPGGSWAMQQHGQRVYLIGSDYVFPRTANLILRDLVNANDGQVLGEDYQPLGNHNFSAIGERIRTLKPDVVFNTLNGDSNAAFFDALVNAGLSDRPLMSFSVAEPELVAWRGGRLTQHYGVWSYFQSLPDQVNLRFVAAYKARFGRDRVTSDPIATSYTSLHLWAQAVEEVGSDDPSRVNTVIVRQTYPAPGGPVSVDRESRHLWRMTRIGLAQPNGQFAEIFASATALRPMPWPSYRTRGEWQALIAKSFSTRN